MSNRIVVLKISSSEDIVGLETSSLWDKVRGIIRLYKPVSLIHSPSGIGFIPWCRTSGNNLEVEINKNAIISKISDVEASVMAIYHSIAIKHFDKLLTDIMGTYAKVANRLNDSAKNGSAVATQSLDDDDDNEKEHQDIPLVESNNGSISASDATDLLRQWDISRAWEH